jgi:hypothetical protein
MVDKNRQITAAAYRCVQTQQSNTPLLHSSSLLGRVRSVVEKEKGVFSRYPKTATGSWGESDRGGIRLWEKVYKEWGRWKSCSVEIG